MKALLLWTAGGVGLAVACGVAGLAHLSATIFTLTMFCTMPAMIIHLIAWCFGFICSLPSRIAAGTRISAPNGAVE